MRLILLFAISSTRFEKKPLPEDAAAIRGVGFWFRKSFISMNKYILLSVALFQIKIRKLVTLSFSIDLQYIEGLVLSLSWK